MKHQLTRVFLAGLTILSSCKKLLEVPPPRTELTAEKVFNSDPAATAFVTHIYARAAVYFNNHLTVPLSIYSDDLTTTLQDQQTVEYFNSSLSASNQNIQSAWRELYSIIFYSNDFLEKTRDNVNLTPAVLRQLTGEVYFLRALSYHYLVELFGDVPLILQTDVAKAAVMPRTAAEKVWEQVVADLQASKDLLTEEYPSADKSRVNRFTALAMLARVERSNSHWPQAVQAASEVLESNRYALTAAQDVFKVGSSETIWQCWTKDGFTNIGANYIPAAGLMPNYRLNGSLVNVFEPADNRWQQWISVIANGVDMYYYPLKYKNRTQTTGSQREFLVALRLAEIYLVLAEASAQQGRLSEAIEAVNAIRVRAGISPLPVIDQQTTIRQVAEERQREFFAESGHRFFDLKHDGRLDEVMLQVKPSWKPTARLFPIPFYELQNNPFLIQNEGY